MYFTSRNKKLAEALKIIKELEKKCTDNTFCCEEMLKIIKDKERLLLNKEIELKDGILDKEQYLSNNEKALKKIYEEKTIGFPWLSEAIAEFYKYIDFEIAHHLESKDHPAYKSAEAVRIYATDNSILRKQLKIAQNFVNYYETLFPWITEYVGESLDELLESITPTENTEEENEQEDPVLKYIQRQEYLTLPEEQRNQKALDRYLVTRKKPWQIGRDYERYIGYLYEVKGYKVTYQGIEKGLEDLGRDLICKKVNETIIIQCKCWASHKVIHEKHINQLYGTAVKYFIENKRFIEKPGTLTFFPDLINSGEIKASLVTSTKLSDTAKRFAEALGIVVDEEKQLQNYPRIKCNISLSGERIYHLPFDQQYDTTLINNRGEFYAMTVQDAMNKGFRRAFRWKGSNL